LTDEEAIFHLQCLNISDPQYIHIGGIDEDGRDASNELSFLLLEAVHGLKIPANISIGVHDGMNPALMRRAVELLFLDKLGIPRFFGAETIANGYARNGIPLRIARQRQQVGCHWTCLPGIEYSFSDVIKINFAKTLNVALREMLKDCAPPSVVSLWSRFERHLGIAVQLIKDGFDWHMEHHARNTIEIVLNLFAHGTIERGLDASAGGVDIYHLTCDAVGLATVADSLAAIEHLVFTGKLCGWDELRRALQDDWQGHDELRLTALRRAPKWGNNDARADRCAVAVCRSTAELINNTPNSRGGRFQMGCWSIDHSVIMGERSAATPDGRRAGEPLAKNAGATIGMDRKGVTGLINSVTKLDATDFPDGSVLDIILHPTLVRGAAGGKCLRDILATFFRKGGFFIHFNVFDAETLKAAQASPEKYANLQVRVCGWNARFIDLSPGMQDCFIREAESKAR